MAAAPAAPARLATKTAPAMSMLLLLLISSSREHFGAQAFQLSPTTFKLQPTSRTRSPFTRNYYRIPITASTMHYQSPSDLAANSVSHQPAGGAGGISSVATSPGPAIFSIPGLLTQDDCPLRVGDPDVRETNTGYTLIFNLPPDVKGDGLDVSVSGRLLTVEARVTREGGGGGSGGGWEAAPYTRTHSAARSFVIPVGVSNEVTASWVSDGVVEIKLDKLPSSTSAASAQEVDTTTTTAASGGGGGAAAAAVATSPMTTAMEDWGCIAVEGKDENKPCSVPSSAVEGYLSSLTDTDTQASPAHPTPEQQMESQSSSAVGSSTSTAAGTTAWPPSHRRRDRSMLAALDDEFRHLAKSMWDEAGVRFPTEEQAAATVARARHERAKRVRVMRRAMMATDVSESDLSYKVRVSLPEGATREDVKLSVTPDNALRVAFSPPDRPPISKVVHLPLDAIFSNVSARFNAEKSQKDKTHGVSNTSGGAGGGGVSSLEVTLGRSPPLLPMSIDIE